VVRPARKVFEADEGDTSASDDQLAGVGTADPNHQVDVERMIDLEHVLAASDRLVGERGDVHVRNQRVQVPTIREHRPPDDVVRSISTPDAASATSAVVDGAGSGSAAEGVSVFF